MAELAASARCAKSADKMDGASSIKTQFSPRFRGNSSTQKLMDRTSLGRAVTSSCLCKNAEGAGFHSRLKRWKMEWMTRSTLLTTFTKHMAVSSPSASKHMKQPGGFLGASPPGCYRSLQILGWSLDRSGRDSRPMPTMQPVSHGQWLGKGLPSESPSFANFARVTCVVIRFCQNVSLGTVSK